MKRILQVAEIVPDFEFSSRDFVAGDAALDFINTVAGRDESPRDRLDSYHRLLEWAGSAHLVPEKTLRALTKKANGEQSAAAAALVRAKTLREALFTMLTAMIEGSTPPRSALALLREHWVAGIEAQELRFDKGVVIADLRSDAIDLDLIAALVARRTVEHVLTQPLDRLRLCHGQDCAWLFIDSSKAGRRRWCDMAVCGNVAKSRRFQARTHRKRDA